MTTAHRSKAALAIAAIALASCTAQQDSPSSAASSAFVPGASKTQQGAIYVSDLFDQTVYIVRNGGTTQIRSGRHLVRATAIAREPNGDLIVGNSRRETPPHQPGFIVTLPAKPGDVHAKRVIACRHFAPWGVAVDASSNIWVADEIANSISEYAPDARGCATPLAKIQGPATQLETPLGVAIDSQGNIVVENFVGDSVEVFAKGASGNVAPIARIAGSNTQIDAAEGIAVDANDNIWVTDYGSAGSKLAAVLEFARGTSGNAAPIREITGSATQLGAIIGLAIDSHTGEIYVCNLGDGYRGLASGVSIFAADADGNVAPARQFLQNTFPSGIVLPR